MGMLNIENTVEDDIKSAMCNLQLFLDDNCQKCGDYLLKMFTLVQIKENE